MLSKLFRVSGDGAWTVPKDPYPLPRDTTGNDVPKNISFYFEQAMGGSLKLVVEAVENGGGHLI